MSLTLKEVLAKSEKRVALLNPAVAAATRKLIENCYRRGVMITIVQGLRTIAEQNALYNQGRFGNPGPKVTNAKGGTSYHNYGLAIDFALLRPDGKNVSWNTKEDMDKDGKADWMEVVEEAKKLGFKWGGDFKSIVDMPHFEMSFGLSTKQLYAGKKPTQAQIQEVIARVGGVNITKEEEPMTKEDAAKVKKLEDTVKELEKTVKELTEKSKTDVPGYAKEAVDYFTTTKPKPMLDTPEGGSSDFYRILTILYRILKSTNLIK
ncbi:Peptidoglycan L-alanyl-D-glutamate endopeptidase CwlK precursor [compost metagenome]